MPRSLWQCVSTGMPTAEASLPNRSLIRPGESPPVVSQYRTREAPAFRAASANSSRYPSSVRDPSSAFTPIDHAPCAPPARRTASRATATAAVISSMIAARSSLPRNLCAIIWSEVEIGQVVMPQARPGDPDRPGCLDVGRDGPAPAGKPQVAEGPRLREGQARLDVGHLVEQEGEPDLGLRHAQPPQVEVDHHLAELRQSRPRGLHSVPVGHVKKVDRWHTPRLTK